MKYLLVILALCFLLMPTLALAQESTAEPTAEVTPNPDPPLNLFPDAPTNEEAGASLLEVIAELTRWASGLLVTTSLVSLLKRTPFLAGVSGGLINFAIATVITILVWFARKYSFELQLFQGLEFLGGFFSLLLNIGSTTLGSAVVYTVAKTTKTPGLGYART